MKLGDTHSLSINKGFRLSATIIFIVLFCGCLIYNMHTLFFPITIQLEHDEAEHLHVAHLLSTDQRPFVDFLENHPMLFHHYLNWAERALGFKSVRALAGFARATIFAHFLICITVFCLWTSRLIKQRPNGLIWCIMLITPWAMVDLYHPYLTWIWHIRPDFICYAYTLTGCYLAFLWWDKTPEKLSVTGSALLVLAGGLVGLGNAVLPKGSVFLAAIFLTGLCVGLMKYQHTLLAWVSIRRILGLIVFATAVLLSFTGLMLLDCHLSQIPIKKWIAGVFLINAKKHIVFSLFEDNPITALISIFSIPLPVILALLGWVFWKLAALRPWDPKAEGQNYLLLFSIFTIISNLLIGPNTNGVTWSYNFIPSIFAAAAIYLLLVLWAWDAFNQLFATRLFHPLILPVAAVFALAFVQLSIQPLHAMTQHSERKLARRDILRECPRDYLRDEILPSSFVYLAHYPFQMPVKAHHWGFYFFLSENRNFWRDCHALGIGPDPKVIFNSGFGKNPPDALIFEDTSDLQRYILSVHLCHQLDITWIMEEIRQHYIPMRHKGVSLYVRKDRTQELENTGWQRQSFSKGLFKDFFAAD